MPLVGLLAWLVPGLGHIFLGCRGRGIVFLVTVTATFWSGVAIGGVRSTVDPQARKLWFVAQLCTAANTLTAYALRLAVTQRGSNPGHAIGVNHWSAVNIGVHYTGVAGLLNILIIFDAIARTEPSVSRSVRSRAGPESVP